MKQLCTKKKHNLFIFCSPPRSPMPKWKIENGIEIHWNGSFIRRCLRDVVLVSLYFCICSSSAYSRCVCFRTGFTLRMVNKLGNITVLITSSGCSFNVLLIDKRFNAFFDHRDAWCKCYFGLRQNLHGEEQNRSALGIEVSRFGNKELKINFQATVHSTSWIRALCLRILRDFMIRTMAACKYNLRSSSTALIVCSTSCGVSRCKAAVILNLVRLFV